MKSLKQLYQNVIELNQKIVSEGLVKLTWGNASGIDRINNRVIIKPSGIDVHELKVFDLSKVSIKTGKLIKGKTPSVDTPTHLEIYKNFNDVHKLYTLYYEPTVLSIIEIQTQLYSGDPQVRTFIGKCY